MARVLDSTVISILLDKSPDADDIARRHNVSGQMVRNTKALLTARSRVLEQDIRADGGTPCLWVDGPPGMRQFTDAQVRAIRVSKRSSGKLAKEYACSPSMIRMIRLRKSYGRVPDEAN